MADSAPKTLKFQIGMDESTVRSSMRMVTELTNAIKKMGEETRRTMAQISGMAGGGAGGGITNKAIRPGMGGMNQIMGGGSQPKGGLVAGVFGTDAAGVRQLAGATQQAFQSAGTGIRSFVQSAESDLKRLNRAMDSVKSAMSSLGGSRFGGGAMGYGNRDTGHIFGAGSPFMGGGPAARPGAGNWGFLGQLGGGAGGVGPRGVNNNWSPFWNGGQVYDGSAAPGGAPPGGGPGGPGRPGPFGRAFGGAMGAMGLGFMGPAMGPAAAFAGYNYVTNAVEGEQASRLNYITTEAGARMSRRAAIASPYNEMFQATQSGDIAHLVAYRRAMARPDVKKMLMDTLPQRQRLVDLETGAGSVTPKSFAQRIRGAVGSMSLSNFGRVPGGFAAGTGAGVGLSSGGDPLSSGEGRTAMQINQDVKTREISVQQAQQLSAAVAAEKALNPYEGMLLNRVYQGAGSRVAAMRSLGMSTRNRMVGGKSVAGYESVEAELTKGGWSFGDAASNRQQVLGIGAGYGGLFGRTGLVSAGMGGLTNAAQLTQMGGVLGGSVGAAGNFYRQVQGSIGRGGLDVAVGRDLFSGLGSRAMASGQFGAGGAFSTYAGIAAGFVGGGTGTPLDVAQQQRRASLLTMGNDQMAGFMNGSKAPLYQMTSMIGSIQAAGGFGGTSESLSRMRPELLQAIAAGGEIPTWAKAQGITKEMAAANLKYQERSPLLSVVDSLQGGPAGDVLRSYREAEARTGGGFGTFAAEQTRGLKGKAKAAKETELAEILGGVGFSQGLFESAEAGTAALLSQTQGRSGRVKGSGVGAAAVTGSEKEALADQSNRMMRAAEMIAGAVEKAVKSGAFKTGGDEAAALGAINEAGKSQGNDLFTVTGDMITVMQRFQSALRNNSQSTDFVRKR